MSADSPRRSSRGIAVPATVPPQVVSDRSILDSAIGFINDVTLTNQPHGDPKDTITWARFETAADISDPRFGEDWELEGNVAPPLLLILGYGLGVQVWAIPANGEAVEALSWRHGVVSALRVLPTPSSAVAIEENGRADEQGDLYADKRPLIAVVDGSTQLGGQQQFCAVNFISLKTGTQVKTIKFKNAVLDVLANRTSIVITFNERIAVFDARTLDDRLSITTCYPSPGINPNPVTLGARWLAYAEHKLIPSKRSGGGCDGEGVASYTATMLNAAKSLGKGLREFGEQMAAGLTGTSTSGTNSKNSSFDSGFSGEAKQPGIVTIMDIKHPIKDYSPTSGTPSTGGPIIAHFVAHSDAVVAMEFDNSGMLLATADRRGHDFHIYRVQPHPIGSSLAAVHHLYILHRGDTSAKVQNIAFSLDSRWVAVSTLRGTTHVFPITPYGGPMGVRTHTSLHVVNKLSRFHRSAGLSAEGRSNSPISHSESTTFTQSLQPYHNPTLPAFPRPTVVQPLAQLRQPSALGSPPGSAPAGGKSFAGGSNASQRQRLSSLSDDNGKPLSVCAIFAKSRSWLLDPPNATREAPHRMQRKAVDSLFVMAGHGALIQFDLDTKLASNVAKEKICDDTPIELEVQPKAQWSLGRRKDGSQEIMPPLTSDNWLVKKRNSCMLTDSTRLMDDCDEHRDEESWLSQVEITTHAGPHRRLWMGPQFVFKNYNTPSGSNLNHVDVEAVEIGVTPATARLQERSSPLNMPLSAAGRAAAPVLIESGSYSSIEMSPKLMDRFKHDHLDSDFAVSQGDSRLKEDLADAMRESPSVSSAHKDTGRLPSDAASSSDNAPFYDALAEHDDDDQSFDSHRSAASAAALASALPNIYSYDTSSSYESLDSLKRPKTLIEKIVNPLGTVTTVTAGMSAGARPDMLDEVVLKLAAEDSVIHENCDEALFRPVVAIFCDKNMRKLDEEEMRKNKEHCKPPEVVGNKLIVPVIAKEDDAELSKKEKLKSGAKAKQQRREQECREREQQRKFAELSSLSAKTAAKSGESASGKGAPVVVILPADGSKMSAEATLKESLSKALAEAPKSEAKEKSEKVEPEPKVANKSAKVVKFEAPKEVETKQAEKPVPAKAVETTRKSKIEEEVKKPEKEEVKKTMSKVQAPVEVRKSPPRIQIPVEIAKDVEVKQAPKKSKQAVEPQFEDVKAMEFKRMTPILPEKPTKQQTAPTEAAKTKKEKSETAVAVPLVSKIKPSEPKTQEKPELKEPVKQPSKVREATPIADEPIAPEQLNVQDLADSLLDLKKSPVEKVAKSIAKSVKETVEDKLLEPVEIYAAPAKPTKKTKAGKQNKSESNSEAEEIVELSSSKSMKSKSPKAAELAQPKKVEEGVKNNAKKSSPSSDESYSELADSLLESKIKSQSGKTAKVEVKPLKADAEMKSSSKLVSEQEKTSKVIEQKEDLKATKSEDKKKTVAVALKMESAAKEEKKVERKPIETAIKKAKPEEELVSSETRDSITPESQKESKGAIKKLVKPSETHKLSPSTSEVDEVKKQLLPVEVTAEKVAKTGDTKTSITVKNESITPPSPKKPNVASTKIDAAKMPSPTTAATSKKTTQPEPAKVITEQPTRSKKTADEPTPAKIPEKGADNKGEKMMKTSPAKDVTDSVAPAQLEYKVKVTESCVEKPLPTKSTSPKHAAKPKENVIVSEPPPSVWKTLSGAEMISKNLESFSAPADNYPSLGGKSNKKKSPKESEEKLLPDLPTPLKSPQDFGDSITSITKASGKKSKKNLVADFDDFPLLEPLEDLPPLPPLEPLESLADITAERKSPKESKEHVSLINFESPLQENPALERKITPAPRGFNEQNLVFALCGSLHYVNENTKSGAEKVTDASPTLSLTRSSSAMGEQSAADKSYTENDEQYMSFEQSSLDTTNTTNEKSSSPNSSSEEIIVLEEMKLSKKQRRKKQLELQQQKEQLAGKHAEDVDEELRPLIGMSDSQLENFIDTTAACAENYAVPTLLLPDSFLSHKSPNTSLLAHSTTTDSEGPMPATTSEDNLFTLPPAQATSTPHKLKTKKLEHKINLLAAIEAATSSSTSSAEESGVEAGRSSDMDTAVVTVTAGSAHGLPQAGTAGSAAQQSAAKKKTKRRGGLDVTDASSTTHCNNIDAKKRSTARLPQKQAAHADADADEPVENLTISTNSLSADTKSQHNSHISCSNSSINSLTQHNDDANDNSDVNFGGNGGGGGGGEQNTIINIDNFDDQLSLSSLPSSSSPPLSLSGMIDANLMHFPAGGESADDVHAHCIDGDSSGSL